MEIKVFTYDYVNDLLRNVEKRGEVNRYLTEKFQFDEKFPKGRSGIELPDDFTLKGSDGSTHFDLENSIALFESMKGMTPTIASDPRLWAYLTHVTFWEYMRSRWPAKLSEETTKPEGRIVERYFLKGINLATLTSNGISRLWWYAFLTFDKEREDKYELTRILLERAEISVGLLERAIGASKNIRQAILIFLKKNELLRKNEDKTREFFKLVNLAGGIYSLTALGEGELLNLFENIYQKAM